MLSVFSIQNMNLYSSYLSYESFDKLKLKKYCKHSTFALSLFVSLFLFFSLHGIVLGYKAYFIPFLWFS